MKAKYFMPILSALIALSFFPSYSFASGDAKTPVFEKGTWQYAIVKQALPLTQEQQNVQTKADLKASLLEANAAKKPNYVAGAKPLPKGDRPLPKTPLEIKMGRILAFSTFVEDKYNTPELRDTGKKIASVFGDLQKSLNDNPLFVYYNIKRNASSDFANITPAGIAFVKSVFKAISDGTEVTVKPYQAVIYKSGAVLVSFKGIPGEPSEILLSFYSKDSSVAFMLGGRARYYAELQGENKPLKI